MASALDAVLQYRAQEQQKQQAQGEQVAQAFQLFQQARQQATANQLAQLQMKASLAKDGLKLDSTGNFVRDESLLSDSDKILRKAKLAEAAQTLGDRGLFNEITGADTSPQIKPPEASNNSQLYQIAKQIDPFTGKLTPEAEEAKTKLDTNNAIEADRRKQVFAARKSFDTYQSDANQALVAIKKIREQSKNLPKFERGFIEQTKAKATAALGEYSKDKEITRYQGVVAQELIPMARKLMEEKGPITEFDVDRVEKGLGDLTTPQEDKTFLLDELQNKVFRALKSKSEIAELSPEDIKGKYSKVFKEASQIDFPETIKTTSQAIDYLMKNRNISKEEAIELIRMQ